MTDGTSLGWHGPSAVDLVDAKVKYEAIIKDLTQQCSFMAEKLMHLEAEVAIQNSLATKYVQDAREKQIFDKQKHLENTINEKSSSSSINNTGMQERFNEMDIMLVCFILGQITIIV